MRSTLSRAAGITYGDVLETRARITPARVAVEYEGHDFTFAELNLMANQAAWKLLDLGTTQETPIGVLSENSLDYLALMYAAAKVGTPLAGLNWRLRAPELAASMTVTEPDLLFVSDQYRDLALDAVARLPEDRRPRVIELARATADDGRAALTPALAHAESANPGVEVDPEQVMLIIYTSGTTGIPKGAALSHRSLLARASIMSTEMRLEPEDNYVAWSPMFHMACSDYLLLTHALGGKVLLLAKFDTDLIVDFLTRERVGWLLIMPGILDRMTDALRADPRPRKPVKYVGTMADLSPLESISNITDALGASYFNTFGTTEVGTLPGASSFIPPGADPTVLSKDQSTFCQIRVVDQDGQDVPPKGEGEMLIRTATMFSGYWNNEQATRECTAGGWYHTGDTVRLHADGTYDYLGRLKYMIKSGGESIYPSEVEQVLLDHPKVLEASVIKVPDEKWSEVPAAYLAADGDVTAEELIEFCAPRLARYKLPKHFRFIGIEEFPRNVTGKVERLRLEERFARGPAQGWMAEGDTVGAQP
ncbi:class I adenylate-forming enzyme family protein [Saccharopolyspora mangrovi]|uniref:Class I adenylate-forming enzyme family protein n=1 Tax=Saccharopolyspora mangrovi TaxID=3082379 RepID=A0ABU6AG39_9PSEU|nr:class I adenylate-forming enzyme family protein [Saccharopolyspora sp. S2-29]MEB3370507.1 class I adenylate-forming enzyme family protein [Saccharopolyspora sp. S2-29]